MSSDDAPRGLMRAPIPGLVAAARRRPIFPHFHIKLTAGYGFEIEVQYHGEGMWIISLSIYAPWDRGRQEIHEYVRYEFLPRSFDIQVRLKRTTWAKEAGFDGNHKRRFLYLGPIVFALDRLQALP